MARNNEPAFRRKTPLLICSIRTEIPYPCIGSSANVFRISISSVPWTRSLGLSGINLLPLGYQEEHTLLLLVVKRRVTKRGTEAGGRQLLPYAPQAKRALYARLATALFLKALRPVVDSMVGDVVQLVRTLPGRWLESYTVTAKPQNQLNLTLQSL